jgi:hypothetical protein
MAVWNILRMFGIFYDHLVPFMFIWYIFSGFGIMYQEKSGDPAKKPRGCRPSRDVIGRAFASKKRNFRLLIQSVAFEGVSCRASRVYWHPGTNVMIFKIFSPKIFAKNFAFFAQTTVSFCKNCDHNNVF